MIVLDASALIEVLLRTKIGAAIERRMPRAKRCTPRT